MAVKKTTKQISSPKKGVQKKISEKTIKKTVVSSKTLSPSKDVTEKSNLYDKLDIFRDCEVKNGRIFLKKEILLLIFQIFLLCKKCDMIHL